jgi:hypothetical protein
MKDEVIESCPEYGPQYGFCPDADWWKHSISYERAIPKTQAWESPSSELEEWFNERAGRWERETAIHSSPESMYLNKDYIAIIGKGMAHPKIIVPLILKRLRSKGGDWFFALENIVGENPARDAVDYESALRAWGQFATNLEQQ